MAALTLEELLAADASATAAPVDVAAWFARVERVAEALDIGPGTTVFDATCGSGAFLLPLAENGYGVGGLDASAAAVETARAAMPAGRFRVGSLRDVDPAEPWDVVVASRGFAGCSSRDDVRGVLARLTAKATHAVAILSLSDVVGSGGSPVDRTWLFRSLTEQGVAAVQFEDDGAERYRVLVRV